MDTNKNKIALQWTVEKNKKDPNSMLYTSLVLMGSAVSAFYFLYTKEYISFVAFLVIFIFMIWYLFAKQPNENVAVTAKGISKDNRFYSFEDMVEYWVPKNQKNIYFRTKGRLSKDIMIPLGNQNIEPIVSLLPEHMVYVEREENVLDKLTNLFN